MRKRGYENIYTSFARGKWQRIEPEKVLDAQAEQQEKNLFQKRWYKELCAGDPYYNRGMIGEDLKVQNPFIQWYAGENDN